MTIQCHPRSLILTPIESAYWSSQTNVQHC